MVKRYFHHGFQVVSRLFRPGEKSSDNNNNNNNNNANNNNEEKQRQR